MDCWSWALGCSSGWEVSLSSCPIDLPQIALDKEYRRKGKESINTNGIDISVR